MTVWTALFTFILRPLELVFELIYKTAYELIKNPGLSIIALSLAMNFLVLPLYRRADAIQEEERDTEAKLNKWVTHIKKTFKGDERTMMLQTYYRQNNYSPAHSLRSAVSLFLEIPFFIAAYRFLSGLELLQGASLGPVADLSKPDTLLVVGGLTIHVLPILMTVVNIISSAIFSKGYPMKTKIQLYAMAAVFLVLLYNSPSGLAFYWTLNNLFSLFKTIFYKLKHPGFAFSALVAACGVGVSVWGLVLLIQGSVLAGPIMVPSGLVVTVPFFVMLYKLTHKTEKPQKAPSVLRQPSGKNFVLSGLFLSVLTGLLIPSAVLKASPEEFVDVKFFVHPLWYLAYSFLLALGFFVLWFGVFYRLASPKARPAFESGMWAFCGVAAADYLLFGTKQGTISSELVLDNGWHFSVWEMVMNGVIIAMIVMDLVIIYRKWGKIVPKVLAVILATVVCMSGINCVQIQKAVATVTPKIEVETTKAPSFTLSKTGKNVVVIMLDRAMGEYVPYIFNERPELKKQFSGFTYYSNVISYGGHTIFATPALYGGYEYTPVELNKRNTEKMKDKQNEALKVMPALFDSKGFDVTVFDPSFASYHSIPDLSIYKKYPNIARFNTAGYFADEDAVENRIENRNRNFFCYGLTKVTPLFMQGFLYSDGQYNRISAANGQVIESLSTAYGTNSDFLNCYRVLENMESMTNFTGDKGGSFLMMSNDITHNAALLSAEDGYAPRLRVNNTKYDEEHSDRFTVDGRTLTVETDSQMSLYHSNAAALIRLGAWFDYLRENGVYDNTRIILVSDHGFSTLQMENFVLDPGDRDRAIDSRISDTEFYYPLLMVKDFNSKGFTVSDEFMTNADVPTLATQDLIQDPINPLTGNSINNAEKTAHDQYIIATPDFYVSDNSGTTFTPSKWYAVHDDIWERGNWTLLNEKTTMPKGAS